MKIVLTSTWSNESFSLTAPSETPKLRGPTLKRSPNCPFGDPEDPFYAFDAKFAGDLYRSIESADSTEQEKCDDHFIFYALFNTELWWIFEEVSDEANTAWDIIKSVKIDFLYAILESVIFQIFPCEEYLIEEYNVRTKGRGTLKVLEKLDWDFMSDIEKQRAHIRLKSNFKKSLIVFKNVICI